jgi:2-polyprenyl-3-methyl-5-hydroxy-6-metoxy-1,4-benzoquinol methylase
MKILDFYEEMPFNYIENINDFSKKITETDVLCSYPVLNDYIDNGVIDVGCGTGWFCNSLSYHHNIDTHGIDFCEKSIKKANEVRNFLKLNSTFEQKNILFYRPEKQYGLVTSLGVLHHIEDFQKAIENICSFVMKKKYLFIGLYNKKSRKPFLDFFYNIENEKKYNNFKTIFNKEKNETFIKSWFRDQVMHPYEKQYEFLEIKEILKKNNMKIISTSLNNFKKIKNTKEIIDKEIELELKAKKEIENKRYYPGYFLVLAQKN